MTAEAESTHRIAELALGALKKIGIPASPTNYEVWYAHVEGRNPALSRAIHAATDAFGKVSQQAADEIYQCHLQRADFSRSVMDLMTRFKEEVTGLNDIIEKTGENASDNKETLGELASQLRQTSEDFPAVGALIEGVFTVANDMRSQNERLETRLAESTDEISMLQRDVENIQAEAMKDPLTGIANRALFDQAMEKQIAIAKETPAMLSLLLADIDHFKSFNDNWGHQTGDQVLRLVAEVMNANVKGQDILARYGGEEFAVILPDTSIENAHMLADRIRTAIESRHLKKRRTNEDLGAVTMSIGVAAFVGDDSVESLIERADQCLYAAKENGRNQVINDQQHRHGPNEDQVQSGAR